MILETLYPLNPPHFSLPRVIFQNPFTLWTSSFSPQGDFWQLCTLWIPNFSPQGDFGAPAVPAWQTRSVWPFPSSSSCTRSSRAAPCPQMHRRAWKVCGSKFGTIWGFFPFFCSQCWTSLQFWGGFFPLVNYNFSFWGLNFSFWGLNFSFWGGFFFPFGNGSFSFWDGFFLLGVEFFLLGVNFSFCSGFFLLGVNVS